jgi:hypothetical protein
VSWFFAGIGSILDIFGTGYRKREAKKPATITVRVSDFSKCPAGRYRTDGAFSGQAFREDVLGPTLSKSSGRVVVHMDGTLGYGSTFLEEAFGGLVRDGFSTAELYRRLHVESSDSSLHTEIWGYIEAAAVSKIWGSNVWTS